MALFCFPTLIIQPVWDKHEMRHKRVELEIAYRAMSEPGAVSPRGIAPANKGGIAGVPLVPGMGERFFIVI